MKYPTAVLAAALLVAGCSSSNDLPDLGAAVTMSPPPANSAIPDSAKLKSALLSESELPAGFGELPDTTTTTTASAPTTEPKDESKTDPPECAAVLEPVADIAPGGPGRAVGHFQGLDFTSIDIDAASYAPASVGAAFAHVQDLFAKCTKYSGKDGDGVDIDFTLGKLDRPKSGDSSVSVRLLTKSEGVTLTTDVVVMVVGTTIVQFAATGTDPIAPQVLTDLVDKQAKKIRAA